MLLPSKPKRDDTKPSRTPNVPIAQAEGDDAAIDRASTPVFGERLPRSIQNREGDDC